MIKIVRREREKARFREKEMKKKLKNVCNSIPEK